MIELMTAIFIISLLSSVAIPVYRRSVDRTKLNACEENLRNIVTSITMYHLEHKRYPQQLQDLLPYLHLSSIPRCPTTQTDTYSAGYQFDQLTGEYTISCSGSNHASLGYGADEPFYSFSKGLGP